MLKEFLIVDNLSYILCFALLFIAIRGSVKESLEGRDSKYALDRLVYYFAVFITFLIIMLNLGKLYTGILKFGNNYLNLVNIDKNIVKILGISLIFFLGQFIIYQILLLLCRPIIKAYAIFLSKGKGRIIIFSTIFGFVKGLIIILILFVGVSTFNNTIGLNNNINIFRNIKGYNTVEKLMVSNRPVISYEEYKDYEKYARNDSNVIIYYNGVTLDQGIKSTDLINEKAVELAKNSKTDREKAKKIYSWVGSNIEYDFDKANKALSNDNISNSGAIEAFNTRRGICFDYACLYVAMAKEVGLKVRIITGQGFNGTSYGPHAWNEVYLKDEGTWIKIDPTFYFAGDYFDNADFDKDHIKENTAGEW